MAKTKTAKRQKDIKSKLIAAICMLLVSTIMMVSSTYAWFTLSTAPEVTGITTAVGANGNLEMALMPKDGLTTALPNFGITSGVGDSFTGADNPSEAAAMKNTTWGNLVDVSYDDFYGLNQIKLYPATLNIAAEATDTTAAILAASLIQTPEYGADGRVSTLVSNAVTSIYNQTNKNFGQDAGYGVRAVGNASGMTDRQLDYRNASANASTYMAQAKMFASQSLQNNGSTLANIAVEKAMGSGQYDKKDVESLQKIVNDLLGYEGDNGHVTGVLEYIDDAYLNYLLAYFASDFAKNAGVDDTKFSAVSGIIEAAVPSETASATTNAMNALADRGVAMPDALTIPVGKLDATLTAVKTAQGELNGLTGDTFDWDQLSTPLNRLANIDAIEVNGYTASEIKANMSALVNSVAAGGIVVTMRSGGGVYADIADHCGNYTASITIDELSAGGLTVTDVKARMQTATNVSPVYLDAMAAAVSAAKAPSSEGGQPMPISDFYGYIIDLAFRTNAAESNLLLQTEGTGRIYDDNQSSAETMGAGSTMTFKSSSTSFTAKQMAKLMESIRLVFFDPATREIYAYAKLDMTEGNYTVVGGDTITAKLYLYEVTAETTTYRAATTEEIRNAKTDNNIILYTKTAGADGQADTYNALVAGTTIDENGEYYIKVVTPAGENLITDPADAVIAALTQNEAKAVSVLVYLEGAHIENADVAANVAESMSGTLNLQFASSATLVPMNYTPLQSQGNTTAPENGGGENP